MNLIKFSFILLCLYSSLGFALTQDEEKKYDELEGLPFIRALVEDKKFEAVIKEFPRINKSENELDEYTYNLALAHFSLKQYQESFNTIKKIRDNKNKTVEAYRLEARSAFYLKKYADCSASFQSIKRAALLGEDWGLFSECLEKNQEKELLLTIFLDDKHSDEDFFLTGQKTLLDHGLYSVAQGKRKAFLISCKKVSTYMSLWSILEAAKTPDLEVLEGAHYCYPKTIELTSLLVKNLFNQGRFHSIAYLFETLSTEEVSFLKHTAEFYKVAGRSVVAEYFFSLGEEKDFILSRSSKFLNNENYASFLSIPFKNLVQDNQELAYALSYSQFKYHNLESSKRILLGQAKKTPRDEALLALIQKCKELDWRCRP